MKVVLVLHNIRSVYNVGAVLRTAEGLGVAEVVFSGYTPRYDDASALPHLRAKLNRQIEKAALGAEKMVRQTHVDDLPKWLARQKAPIVGLENNLSAEDSHKRLLLPLRDPVARPSSRGAPSARSAFARFSLSSEAKAAYAGGELANCSSEELSQVTTENAGRATPATAGGRDGRSEEELVASSPTTKIILLLGEEVSGIPPEIRALCNHFLEIPMRGRKESFNVSVAAAIALWELTKD